MKGLKQLVSEAMAETKPPPVEVSNEAKTALAHLMRKWSGWPNSIIKFGKPTVSPWAQCDHNTRTFTVNTDDLILNPNRVLLTVTPFRLKQEAVLTGVLLHESGHARHTHWRPRTEETAAAWVHGDTSTHEGEPVNRQTLKLAMLMEEPRIEGLMARNAASVGASGLGWTMRAASAKLAPFTHLSTDPGQRVMDVMTSWAIRAGKQIAIAHWSKDYTLPQWVQDLTSLLHGVLVEHLLNVEDDNSLRTPQYIAQKIIDQLILMAVCVDDTGTYMVDSARDILDMLFPETDGDDPDAPQPGEGCTAQPGDAADESPSESGDDGEGDEEGEDGEGNTEPEDEGSGEDPGAGDSGDDDAEPSEKDGKGDESAEQDEDEVSEDSDTDEPSDEADEPAQEGDPGGTQEADTTSALAKALAALEAGSKDQTTEEAEELSEQQGDGGGSGDAEGGLGDDWRMPTKEEREIQHGAERFLRSMIEPTERSRVTLSDTPSSTIDGAAYEAWTAGGRVRAPHFFKQTRRSVEPSPPVKIAVLVDVSMSMDVLTEPSAVLSWALSAAAQDLQNFAGRGQQIESTLIHWGNSARVVQEVGKPMPAVRVWQCSEFTTALPEAMALVEEQMPGFFDVPMTPVNRLIVHFTDWELGGPVYVRDTEPWIVRTLESGVSMLSVVPSGYSVRKTKLNDMLAKATVQRGKASLIKYNPLFPGQVWDTAADVLSDRTPAPFAGF